MTRRSISITFETTTPECDGDFADHGWLTPAETEVSLRQDCRGRALQAVAYASRVKRAQRGKFEWTLRDAVRFMLDKRLDSMRYAGCRDGLQVDSQDQQDEYAPGESKRYTLHIEASYGTLDRLARVLEAHGARDEWKNHTPARTARTPESADDECPPDSERTRRADHDLDQAKDRRSELGA